MDQYYNRIDVYKNTQQMSNIYYPNQAQSIKCTEDNMTNVLPKSGSNPIISILKNDTLDECRNLILKGLNPVLLNMADPSIPGGCVNMGASAQEENIFRRTNYFMTLKLVPEFYPIIGSDVIYSNGVLAFRSNEESGYKYIQPFIIDIIACPSIRHPELDQNGLIRNKEDLDLQYSKICMIFKTAIKYGHDSLVLSALGCGAFKWPAEQVANLFKRAIDEYGSYFKEIVFAIKQPIDNQSKNNYQIFKDIIAFM